MLSPFTAVDHRIPSLPHEERRVPRRSQPERLRFEPPELSMLPQSIVPEPRPIRARARFRVRLGCFLMALGQRLAGPDIAS